MHTRPDHQTTPRLSTSDPVTTRGPGRPGPATILERIPDKGQTAELGTGARAGHAPPCALLPRRHRIGLDGKEATCGWPRGLRRPRRGARSCHSSVPVLPVSNGQSNAIANVYTKLQSLSGAGKGFKNVAPPLLLLTLSRTSELSTLAPYAQQS